MMNHKQLQVLLATWAAIRKYRFYVAGALAWAIIIGAVTTTFVQWGSHGAANTVAADTKTPPRQDLPATPVVPAVAGASTDTPSAPPQVHLAATANSKPAPVRPPLPLQATNPTQTTPDETAPATPASPPVITEPETPPEPEPTPPADPTPTANIPTANLECAVLSTLDVTGPTSLTVPVGGQTALQVIATADESNVLWLPAEPVTWSDGTTSKPLSPVSMILTYVPGSITGNSVTFYVSALGDAIPGTVVEVSWHYEDGARGICQNVSVPVTVVAVDPIPVVLP